MTPNSKVRRQDCTLHKHVDTDTPALILTMAPTLVPKLTPALARTWTLTLALIDKMVLRSSVLHVNLIKLTCGKPHAVHEHSNLTSHIFVFVCHIVAHGSPLHVSDVSFHAICYPYSHILTQIASSHSRTHTHTHIHTILIHVACTGVELCM